MGVYDSVMVPCPKCGQEVEAQTKSGPCNMDTFSLSEAPADVLEDVNRHAPFTCYDDDCKTALLVGEDLKPRLVTEAEQKAKEAAQREMMDYYRRMAGEAE